MIPFEYSIIGNRKWAKDSWGIVTNGFDITISPCTILSDKLENKALYVMREMLDKLYDLYTGTNLFYQPEIIYDDRGLAYTVKIRMVDKQIARDKLGWTDE